MTRKSSKCHARSVKKFFATIGRHKATIEKQGVVPMKYFFVCVFLLILNGCASMADSMSNFAGVGVISEKQSTFDGSHVIELTPAWLYDPKGSFGNSYKIGARWNSSEPGFVGLLLNYASTVQGDAYTTFNGIEINIDGSIVKYSAATDTDLNSSGYVSGQIYTSSDSMVIVPVPVIRDMIAATDCRIRIHSSDGYEDSVFNLDRMPGGQGLARPRFAEFLSRIDQNRAK